RAALVSAARSLGAPDDLDLVLERPKDPSHGDWATNLAMTLARPLRRKPADIARDLVAKLDLAAAGIERVHIVNLGRSVQARLAQLDGRDVPIPDGGYHGEYILDIAQRYRAEHLGDAKGTDLDAITKFAVKEL